MFVSHRERRIEVIRRGSPDWVVTAAGPGETAALTSIGCTLSVDDVYSNVDLRG